MPRAVGVLLDIKSMDVVFMVYIRLLPIHQFKMDTYLQGHTASKDAVSRLLRDYIFILQISDISSSSLQPTTCDHLSNQTTTLAFYGTYWCLHQYSLCTDSRKVKLSSTLEIWSIQFFSSRVYVPYNLASASSVTDFEISLCLTDLRICLPSVIQADN